MQPLSTKPITAPGFAGLNTNDAPVDMDVRFALIADNCVIDQYGRVGSRKGWVKVSTNTNAELGSNSIRALCEFVEVSGTRTIVGAGNNHLYKLVGTTWTTLTYGGGGVAPTITSDNWQIVFLGNAAIFFQRGYDPLIYDVGLSTTQYRRMSEHPIYAGTIPKANCALSAWGRVWCADTDTETMTVTWCDTLSYMKWSGGAAGSLNLQGVWPAGGDRIVALAAHNNFLFIFGTRQILVYSGASTPSTMTLYDTIMGIGCAARDSIQNTEDDLIFLSDSGVRSIERTIQEKSAPIGTISANVNKDIINYTGAEGNDSLIKSGYSQSDFIYLLTFGSSLITYCFDTRVKLENGAMRVTTWTGNVPTAYLTTKDRILYLGQAGYLGKYSGYQDNGSSYRMSYYDPWESNGDPDQLIILKSIIATIIGASNQPIIFKWGFDYSSAEKFSIKSIPPISSTAQYGIAEYGIGEYGNGIAIARLSVPGSGSGRVLQIGLEFDVNGNIISIQSLSSYTKRGRH